MTLIPDQDWALEPIHSLHSQVPGTDKLVVRHELHGPPPLASPDISVFVFCGKVEDLKPTQAWGRHKKAPGQELNLEPLWCDD